MTPAQKRTVDRLKRDILVQDGFGQPYVGRYEYKRFDVKDMHGIGKVFLSTSVGSKTDRGTMAALVCRKRRHIQIGPRGGVKSLLPGKRVRGYRNVLIHGYEY